MPERSGLGAPEGFGVFMPLFWLRSSRWMGAVTLPARPQGWVGQQEGRLPGAGLEAADLCALGPRGRS